MSASRTYISVHLSAPKRFFCNASEKVPISMACTMLTLHLPAAAPTDHLAFQNIVCRLPLWNYIVYSSLKCLLNGIKCSRINQRFVDGFYSPFLFPLYQHPRICAIGKDMLHRPAVPTVVAILKVPIQTVVSCILDRSRETSLI